ncbi:PREDICTED: uncharacterized protein LOC105951141 [Erythranthe guttata]|uniref:uncharacterized protein LOC105951141 n=1 Tax=Erythranthe guttata TaxID=4155 RepID=UPI00064DDFC6|nr:PREDICTED: uncharacterized protein LOC105951141 [Erythranthe guttata]|eukprot:XP_012829984.1 PREDICTED: uncharacterized protein LOC105951141 [Erythranthe guttata]
MVGLGEENWAQVRRDMLTELKRNHDIYIKSYKVWATIEELVAILDCWVSPADRQYWMTLPYMGHIIAHAYNIVVQYFSKYQCLTFLPLSSDPVPVEMRQEHGLAFVNNNHFVHVVLKNNCPMPPIVDHWTRYHEPKAEGWKTSDTEDRIATFRGLVSSKRSTPLKIL